MSERRKAIIAKFRSGGIDRLRKLLLFLNEAQHEGAPVERLQEVRRELHTLKGEATMLNFLALAELVHAAEDVVAGTAGGTATPITASAGALITALETASRWLGDELGAETGEAALRAAGVSLKALLEPGKERRAYPATEHPAPPAPAVDTASAAATPSTPHAAASQRWVQVSAQLIDQLCEKVSDFESELRALHFHTRTQARESAATDGVTARALRSLLTDFDRCQASLDDITSSAWSLRLVTVEPVLAELVSHARSIAASQDKPLRVVVEGGEAQLERSLLDALWDPLLHLVRNAVDHGLERAAERHGRGPGVLTISAEPVGTDVALTIADDGRGIDCRKVRDVAVSRGMLTREAADALEDAQVLDLLFAHGFTTRSTVTDLSGRGVGLDVVRSAVEAVGGVATVESELGKGTTFTLTVPSTISKERNLVMDLGDGLYAIPSRNVLAVERLEEQRVHEVAGGNAVHFGEEVVPLRSLRALLSSRDPAGEPWVAFVNAGAHRWAFAIPKPLGEFSLLRRPIDEVVAIAPFLSGSATFEDGRLVLILSIAGLARRAREKVEARAPSRAVAAKPKVLVVDDSAVVRDLVSEVLGHAGLDVSLAGGGEEALATLTRGRFDCVVLDIDMPVMSGFDVLERIRARSPDLPVIMLTLRASAEDQRRAALLRASAYVVKSQFQETTLVDTIRRFLGGADVSKLRVLVVDDSAVCRDLLREMLEGDGDIEVVAEAGDGAAALEEAARVKPNLVTLDLEMPHMEGLAAVERIMARHPVPILIVTGKPADQRTSMGFEAVRRGALDLIAKPTVGNADAGNLRTLVRRLASVPVVRHMAGRSNSPRPLAISVESSAALPRRVPTRVVGIGASAGGPAAIAAVLERLPRDASLCVAVVQHLLVGFVDSFASFLQQHTELAVELARPRAPWRAGTVLVAPDHYHLVATAGGLFDLVDLPRDGFRPSADALFASLARHYGAASAGIILSGMGEDGVAGLAAVRAAGGLTIAQDKGTAAVYGMPRAALEKGAATVCLPTQEIAAAVVHAARGRDSLRPTAALRGR